MTNLEAKEIIRKSPDPLASVADNRKLQCKEVHAVFEPDPDGLREVLFTTFEDEPMTAYLRGKTVAFVSESW